MPDLPSTLFSRTTGEPVPFEVGYEPAEIPDDGPFREAEAYDGVIYLDRVPVFRHRLHVHRATPWHLAEREVKHQTMAAFARRLAALLTPEDPE